MPGRSLSQKAQPRGLILPLPSFIFQMYPSSKGSDRCFRPGSPEPARAPYTPGAFAGSPGPWDLCSGSWMGRLIRSSPLPSSSISYRAVMIPFFLGSSVGSVSGVSVSSGVSGSVSLSSSGTGRSGFSGFPGFLVFPAPFFYPP